MAVNSEGGEDRGLDRCAIVGQLRGLDFLNPADHWLAVLFFLIHPQLLFSVPEVSSPPVIGNHLKYHPLKQSQNHKSR